MKLRRVSSHSVHSGRLLCSAALVRSIRWSTWFLSFAYLVRLTWLVRFIRSARTTWLLSFAECARFTCISQFYWCDFLVLLSLLDSLNSLDLLALLEPRDSHTSLARFANSARTARYPRFARFTCSVRFVWFACFMSYSLHLVHEFWRLDSFAWLALFARFALIARYDCAWFIIIRSLWLSPIRLIVLIRAGDRSETSEARSCLFSRVMLLGDLSTAGCAHGPEARFWDGIEWLLFCVKNIISGL